MDGAGNDVDVSADTRPSHMSNLQHVYSHLNGQPGMEPPQQEPPSFDALTHHARNKESFSRSRVSTGAVLDASTVNDMFDGQDGAWPKDQIDFPQHTSDEAIRDFHAAFAPQDSEESATSQEIGALIHSEPTNHHIAQDPESTTATHPPADNALETPHQEPVHAPPQEHAQQSAEGDPFAASGQGDEWANVLGNTSQTTEDLFGAGTSEPLVSAVASAGDAPAESATVMTTDMPSEAADETIEELKAPLVEHEQLQAEATPAAPIDDAFHEAAKSVSADLQQLDSSNEPVESSNSVREGPIEAEGPAKDSWEQALGGTGNHVVEHTSPEALKPEEIAEDSWAQVLGAEDEPEANVTSRGASKAADAEEDSWAQALGAEDKSTGGNDWDAAFGDELDEDGFLDEDGLLEDEPAQTDPLPAQPKSNPYAPLPTMVPQITGLNQSFLSKASLNYGTPQPNPIQEQPVDRTPSGGMKFFEDLPMAQPTRYRKPKQQLVSNTLPSGPTPPLSGPPSASSRQVPTSDQQQTPPPFRAPEKLDLFPPQPNNPMVSSNIPQAYTPSLQPPAPPQTNARYSPAPSQSPPVTYRYSAAPPARGNTPSARYSPAPIVPQTSQAGPTNAIPPSNAVPQVGGPAPPALDPSYFPTQAGQTSAPPAGPPRRSSQYSPAPVPPQTAAVARTKSPASVYDPANMAPQHLSQSSTAAGNRFAPAHPSPLAQPDVRPQLDRSATMPLQAQRAIQTPPNQTAPMSPGRTPALQRASINTASPSDSSATNLPYVAHEKDVGTAPSSFHPLPATQPPSRPRTQSPVLTKGMFTPTGGQYDRRSSAQGSPVHQPGIASHPPVPFRTRGPSVSDDVNYVQPDDPIDASDPLHRWKGAPIIHWSTSGLVSSQFPKRVPRYGGGQAAPAIKCSPGDIKLRRTKDVMPTEEPLRTFPGPLKSKGKKKDLLAWLSGRIEVLQRDLSNNQSMSMDPRPSERLILWQLMRIFVENDGGLTGNPSLDNSVRQVLGTSSEPSQVDVDDGAPPTGNADSVNAQTVAEIRRHLLGGDREKAVWLAVDNRLWGHAMLISSTMDGTLWKQVVQEFVRNEVRTSSGVNQSLGALYQSFAHNWDETIDELVPASARAGFQMMPTADMPKTSQNALNGLNKWQETLSLILSNRSAEDERSLLALGKLLRDYGRLEAAHTCFLFSRNVAKFGGSDEPDVNFTLLGTDVSSDAVYDVECIMLSEIYEFALSLAPAAQTLYIPHLQAYKLHHAYALAECGLREEALQYCEAIAAAMKSTTRLSPYYHPILVNQLDDLTKRLSQSPKDSASSWISKPSIGKVGSNVWAKFNSFVAGDEDAASNGSGYHSEPEAGPFSRLGPGTPTISRNPSQGDLTAFTPMTTAGSGSRYAPSYGTHSQPQVTPVVAGPYAPAASSYAPVPAARSAPRDIPQQPAMSQGTYSPPTRRDSFGPPPVHPNPYQPAYHLGISDSASQGSSSYDPPILMPSQRHGSDQPYGSPSNTFSDRAPSSHGEPSGPHHQRDMSAIAEEVYDPNVDGYKPTTNGYAPSNDSYAPQNGGYEPSGNASYELSGGSSYEPPGGGYGEPQAYTPYEPEPDSPDVPKAKKKAFMDDDDDYKPQKAVPAKSREPDDAVRRAAEADDERDKANKARRSSGWFGGWLGGKKDPNAPTPTKATLGDELSFYYDPETKKWVNKKGGAEQQASPAAATPPPPRSGPPTSKPPSSVGTPDMNSGPPMRGPPSGSSQLQGLGLSGDGLGPSSRSGTPARIDGSAGPEAGVLPPHPAMASVVGPPSNPPSRPQTSMSNASSIDDLIGAPAARKGGTVKKGKKGGRYVDIMAK